jgi:broad specificity phosphatase PhoE
MPTAAGADPASRPELRALRRRPLFAPLAVPALLFAVVLGAAALLWAAADTTTIIVVRHAEKQLDGGKDPLLTAEGAARAQRLARQYGGAGLVAVYSTPYHRTRDTAAPVAAAAGVPVTEYDPKDVAALVDAVHAAHLGGTVFVVGHSNTVGKVVQGFGGDAADELPDTEYDHVYIVTAPRFGRSRTLHLSQ